METNVVIDDAAELEPLPLGDDEAARAARYRMMGFGGSPPPAPVAGAYEESPRWMDPEYRRQAPDWTERVPRPAADDGTPDYLLGARQAVWDEADAKWRGHRDWVAERQAERERADLEAKEAADRRHAERELAKLTAEIRPAYFAADPTATDADFARDLPDILAERRRQAAAAAAGTAAPLRSLITRDQFLRG